MKDELEIEIENLPEGTLNAYLSIERVASHTVTAILMGEINKADALSMDVSLVIARDLVNKISESEPMFAKVWSKYAAEWVLANEEICPDHAVYVFSSIVGNITDNSITDQFRERYGTIID